MKKSYISASKTMDISVHISSLLFDHDCVILPGLGGFVSNCSPASINSSTHTFYPPHKNIIFNKSLLNNDGLLVHKIASDLSLSYVDANNMLTEYIESCKVRLLQLRRIELENIGVLYLDREENLQFIQDKNTNYSFDAFGLPVFKFRSLEQQSFGESDTSNEKEKKLPFKDRKPIEHVKKVSAFRKYAPALALIPVAALLLWLPFKMKSPDSRLNKAGWDFSNDSPIVSAQYKPNHNPILSVYDDAAQQINKQLFLSIDSVQKANTLGLVIEAIADSTSVSVDSKKTNQTARPFHVMAGCFADKSNADKLVESLRSMGFAGAGIIGYTNSGLIRVAYASHSSREEAVVTMNIVKENTSNVWILNK